MCFAEAIEGFLELRVEGKVWRDSNEIAASLVVLRGRLVTSTMR